MSETQSKSTRNATSKDGTSQITPSSHARTAKIRRTREVIERVEVEHVAEDGEPPVTTTAEQRVFKSTNMERGKQINVEAPQEQITSRRQPVRAAKKDSQTQVDIPIQAADTNGAAPAAETQQEGPHHMSTQEYMEEAEELLTHPMPETQPEDTAPEAAVAAEEEIAAGNLAEQTPEDAAAAGEHLAEHIQPAAGAEAPALGEQPSTDAGADAAAPAAGEAGLVGRVAQVGRRIVCSLLHPDDTAAVGEGAAHGEGETGDEDQAVGVVAALAEGGETEGEDQAVGVVPAASEVDEGVVQPGSGQSDESFRQVGQLRHRRLAEVAAEVAAETAQADLGEIQAGAGNQEDPPLLAEVVAVEAVPAEDEGYQRDIGDEEEAEALALAETTLEGESAAALLADTSAQPAADELGGTLVEGADEDEASAAAEVVVALVAQEEGQGAGEGGLPATAGPAAAPEQAGLDAAQEGVLDRVAPAVLAEIAATVAELEPGASLEEAAGPVEPAALAQVTAAEVADENAGNAEPDLEEPAAVAEVAAAAIADGDAGADAEPGAAAADTSEGDDIVALAAAAEVAAAHTSEGARVTQPAETSFDTAHDKIRAQPVPEVAGILEVTLPAVVTSQGATAEDEDLTAAASLAAQDFDNETVGTSEGADRARRVVDDEDITAAASLAAQDFDNETVGTSEGADRARWVADDEDLITAAALAVQDFDAAGDITAEQALTTAAVLAAGDFAEADEADERAAKDAAEQGLLTAAVLAAEDFAEADEAEERAAKDAAEQGLLTAAVLAAEDFAEADEAEERAAKDAAEQGLLTAAALAAGDFAEADEADERAAKDAAEQALITAAGVAAEEYYGMEDEPGLEDSEGQAVGAAEGDEGGIEGEPMEEEGQPEQPAAETEQEYHVEEPAQSAEEVEAPAEPPQKAPKGCGATKKTTKSAVAQAADAGDAAPEEAAKGAGAKRGRDGAKKLKPYTPAKMATMRGSPDEVQPVEEVLTQRGEEAAPAPRTPPAKRGRPAAPKTPPKTKGRANPAKELLEADKELEAPPATAEDAAAPSNRGRGQPSKNATKSSLPAKRSRAESSEQAAQEDNWKKANKTGPKSPPSGQAGQGRAGPSKAPEATPAAPAQAPRKTPPTKSSAAAAKKAPAKGPSDVSRARTAGVQERPARQLGRRRKERPESFKTYLYRVLKEIHPDVGLSMKAISVLDNFTKDMRDKIANEAADLCRRHNRATLSSREIDAAVRFLLPGELFNHAVSEGRKAVARALSSSE